MKEVEKLEKLFNGFKKAVKVGEKVMADGKIDWSDSIKEQQRNWIGKSKGATLAFNVENSDLKISNKILSSIKNVIKNNNFILGKEVFDFERKFSLFCGSRYAISCSNGTDAITLALLSLNLKNMWNIVAFV